MRTRALCLVAALIAALFVPSGAPAAAPRPAADDPYTVIAVVDSGIDPYHLDFRRPQLTAHPSTYIEGFPKKTPALRLSLNEKNWSAARGTDRKIWDSVKPDELYWVPGTNIIGAVGPFDMRAPIGYEEGVLAPDDAAPILDEVGHGTAVASLAAGAIHGPDTERTLIVAVQGFEKALAWAAAQPWIDVVTNSWWNLEAGDYAAGAKASRAATESGKVVCFASGNFSHPQLYTSTQGPSWTINVGAASKTTRGEHYYTNYPNDVLGLAGVKAATAGSIDKESDFAGTSAAAPSVCGLIAKTISDVRAKLGDGRQGARPGSLAAGRRLEGHLDDGKLTRAEIEDAVQSTAVPAESSTDTSDPNSIPASPAAPFVRGGYGIVDERSIADALDVILGRAERPDRAVEDAWMAAIDAVRDAIWTNMP